MLKLFRSASIGLSVVALATGLTTTASVATASASTGPMRPNHLSTLCGFTNSEPQLAQGAVNTSAHSPVKQAQCELNWAYALEDGDPLSVDGRFGTLTKAETQEFQRCVHIAADGIIGPDTWAELDFWVNQSGFACG
jgi:zinc D-Ala-D-Ala carboxypeptidase